MPDPPLVRPETPVNLGTGLSDAEAAQRLRNEGPNELPRGPGRSRLAIALEVLTEPLIALLFAAAVLYLIFGEPRDALVLVASVVVVVALDIYQESRAERALEALRDLAAPHVTVIRAGRRLTVPAAAVVRGDLVSVSEGERIPADGTIRSTVALLVDESLLTGESVPVRKVSAPTETGWSRPGGEDLPFVYGQTLVVRGQAVFEVRATGGHTEASRIARALASIEPSTPLIRQQVRPLVLGVGIAAIVLTALLAVVVGLRSGDWILGLLAGTALAIGLLPEEIPIVTTVYSVLGARRMARRQALARRFGTIPALGCLTVLCTDKTGTLTQNRMTVSAVVPATKDSRPLGSHLGDDPDPLVREVLRIAALANEPEPVDPMEVAVAQKARDTGVDASPGLILRRHLPFSHELRLVRNLWATPDGAARFVAAKGAPESLFDRCDLSAAERGRWEEAVTTLARGGYRAIAVASSPPAAETAEGAELVDGPLELRGLIGLADPLRDGVPEAMARCHAAGVRVLMITGDHPETARAIARAAGIREPERLMTGDALEAATDEELAHEVRRVNVYARVRPEQKLRLVEALKADSEVVAMTGDGVNDAPALRAAHVGIAMGQRGTDVAREAASLVLLDDAFPTVADAIQLGRRVYENMRKALYYVVAIHVAIAGMALLPVLFGFPILLFPVEIVFLELIIDPVSSLVFEAEPEEADVMRRAPRDPNEPILGSRPLVGSLLLGASALAAALAVYLGAILLGHPLDESRALGFTTLVVGNLAMVYVCRSSSRSILGSFQVPNPLAGGVALFGSGLLLLSVYFSPLANVFQFLPPAPLDFAVAVGIGIAIVVANDGVKRRWLAASPPRRDRGARSAAPAR